MAGRGSFLVRMGRLVQALPLWMFRFTEWPFIVCSDRRNGKPKAFFLLALPRSGSTLTYQSICHSFSVQYLSNAWNLLYQLPLLGGVVSRIFCRRYVSDFKSSQGFVSGLDGPSEGMRFWKYWLDSGLSHEDSFTVDSSRRAWRASYIAGVLSFLTAHREPFVCAYLGHALIPERLFEVFPDAVFIRLRRDPVSNAMSILKQMRSNGDSWFSVVPEECRGLERAGEHERVAAQVYWLNRRLDGVGFRANMLDIWYEDLCNNPEGQMERIRAWSEKKGVPINSRLALPESFEYKQADLENNRDAIKIKRALDELEETNGPLRECNEP